MICVRGKAKDTDTHMQHRDTCRAKAETERTFIGRKTNALKGSWHDFIFTNTWALC